MVHNLGTLSRIGALTARERKTRFADGSVGYAWAFITPVVWIGFVVVLFRMLNRTPPIQAGPEIFVATAIIPYLSFRQTVTSLSRSHAAHRYLRYIRGVRISDIVLATGLLEGFNLLATVFLICGTITVMFGAALPDDVPDVLLALIILWTVATGFGRLVAAIGLFSDGFARAIPLILRPLFWISGIFYVVSELPATAQNFLWFNPILHITEAMRDAYFAGYSSPMATLWYPLAFGAFCFLLAHPIEGHAASRRTGRHRI